MASPVGVMIGAKKVRKSNKDAKCEGSSFWRKLMIFGCCITLRSKSEGSSSGNNKQDGSKSTKDNIRDLADDPAASLSNNNSGTIRSTSNICKEIKYQSHLRNFTFQELKLATGNFKRENFLGEGGFGTVFKGSINGNSNARPGMGIPVAVKTLKKDGNQGHKEWVAEIIHLGALHHPNIVKLFGFCTEGEDKPLVYEFMPQGSLENHLFKSGALPLSWNFRMKIMLGAAKGLAFLHEEAEKPMIHRDFKTSNILLDKDYNAKLSDFGLVKEAPVDRTHVSTQVMGTKGYAAPEYVMTGHLTTKSDVYSFGVVLLEVLTGRRVLDRPHPEQCLVNWAMSQIKHEGGFRTMMDPRLQGQFSQEGAERAMRLAVHCLSHDHEARPVMSEVVQVLESMLDHNDMASSSSSPSFQGFHVGSSSRNAPIHFETSACSHTPPVSSTKTSGGRP